MYNKLKTSIFIDARYYNILLYLIYIIKVLINYQYVHHWISQFSRSFNSISFSFLCPTLNFKFQWWKTLTYQLFSIIFFFVWFLFFYPKHVEFSWRLITSFNLLLHVLPQVPWIKTNFLIYAQWLDFRLALFISHLENTTMSLTTTCFWIWACRGKKET